MRTDVLKMSQGSPMFDTEDKDVFLTDDFCVELEMINMLIGATELEVLNRTKAIDSGRVLGSVGVGRVLFIPALSQPLAHKKGIAVGSYVLVSGSGPCLKCDACQEEQFEFCVTPQKLGVDRDGTWGQRVSVPLYSAHKIAGNPEVEPVQQYLTHDVVAKAIWVSTQDFLADNTVGVIGRPMVADLMSKIIEDFSSVSVEKIRTIFSSPGNGHLDVLIDCDGESFATDQIASLLRPGGILVSSYSAARINAVDRLFNTPIRHIPLALGPTFLALEWIAQNPQVFANWGVPFAFNDSGVSQILHSEGLREERGLLYFDTRPDWVEISNSTTQEISLAATA